MRAATTAEALPSRFWSKVTAGPAPTDRPDLGPCWMWTACTNSKGYGLFWLDGTAVLAHRLAYTALVGPLGDLVPDHLCRNRVCVNPNHLEPVTIAENSRRGDQQNRATCKRGHLLGYRMRRGKQVRCCRLCESIDRKARRAATAEVLSAVAMVAFLAGFPIAIFVMGTTPGAGR